MILAAGGSEAGGLAGIAVLVTALGGAVAAVLGALSSRRSKAEAEEAQKQASEQAAKSFGLEERTVARSEFDSVVAGLRAWAEGLSTQLGEARAELEVVKQRLEEKDAQILSLNREAADCHQAKAALQRRLDEMGAA